MKTSAGYNENANKHVLSSISHFLSQHTLVALTGVFCINIVCILWYMDYKQSALVESIAIKDAEIFSDALAEFRTLYTSEVVVTAKQQGVEITHDYMNREGAIPLPATLSMLLGEKIGTHQSGAQTRLYSPFPFPWREENGGLKDAFSKAAWDLLSNDPENPYYRFEEFQGRKSIRFATADLMRPSCVNCHNSHASTPKNDWKVGDVRGVLEVILPLDDSIAQARSSLKDILGLLILLSLIISGCLALVFRNLKRISLEAQKSSDQMVEINKELENARDELEDRVQVRTSELQQEVAKYERSEEVISESLHEKEILLKEIHHRVKNNLQIITSLLNLQAGRITDSKTQEIFSNSMGRVKSMALIHEQLYLSENLTEINVSDYVRSLTSYLLSTIGSDLRQISIIREVDEFKLPVDMAVPCGLIINELVTNAMKYAFPNNKNGEIIIALHEIENGKVMLSVSDNGVGIREHIDIMNPQSLGMQLVHSLTDQLDGELQHDNEYGTRITIEFECEFDKYDKEQHVTV